MDEEVRTPDDLGLSSLEIVLNCTHECRCACHEPDSGMRHIMACCGYCDLCKRNIKNGQLGIHMKNCHKKGDKK